MSALYFAYGSNMCSAQMTERCPSAKLQDIAVLPGHRLTFPRFSSRRRCGVAGFCPDPQSDVWGVVYRLSAEDLMVLDRIEGYDPQRQANANRYNRITVEVRLGGPLGAALRCHTYDAVPEPGSFIPSADYKETMVRGARTSSLPHHYLDMLLAVDTSSA
jgi:gamma-glutamylcyclotransferase (GGCT)/AIG2-like uncharacterized protein YtfP